MVLKGFDFKKFLREKGERIGLGVTGAVLGILLLVGLVGAASSGSSSSNAKDFKEKGQALRDRHRTKGADEGIKDLPADLKEVLQTKVVAVADADDFRSAPLFDSKPLDDKRRNPFVLTPAEFRSDLVLAGVRSYILSKDRDKILVLKGLTADASQSGQVDAFQKGLGGSGGRGRMPDGFEGAGSPDGGSPDGGERGGIPGYPDPTGGTKVNAKPEYLEIAKLQTLGGAKLAELPYPLRMVVVSGSFPYKKQVEEFQKKLLYLTLGDLLADEKALPQFLGLEVQRRVVVPGGKVKWEKLNLLAAYDQLVSNHTGPRFEPDEPGILSYELAVPGLVMPRPLLRTGQYPKEEELPKLKETLDALKQASAPTQVAKPKRGLGDPTLNIFDPSGGQRQLQPGTTYPVGQDPMGSGTLPQQVIQWNPPDYCLFRFVDWWNLEPGKTYEYGVRIKMSNPNYQRKDVAWPRLAEDKELWSDWVVVDKRVSVPADSFFYAVEPKKITDPSGERLALQAHRWLPVVRPDPKGSKELYVADWVVAEKMKVGRGEYIFRIEEAEVPVWSFAEDKFVMATNPEKPRAGTVPVPMAAPRNDPILVDFEGGKATRYNKSGGGYVLDDSAIEMLILSPEGKLLTRDSATDTQDETRKQRFEAWSKRVKEVKDGKTKETKPTTPFGTPPP